MDHLSPLQRINSLAHHHSQRDKTRDKTRIPSRAGGNTDYRIICAICKLKLYGVDSGQIYSHKFIVTVPVRNP